MRLDGRLKPLEKELTTEPILLQMPDPSGLAVPRRRASQPISLCVTLQYPQLLQCSPVYDIYRMTERRRQRRDRTDAAVELIWKEDSYRRFECGRIFDSSRTGAGVACPQPLVVSSYLILRAPGIDMLALVKVRNCMWRRTQYHLGIEFADKASIQPRNPALEPDHHELLRAGVAGDAERLDRVYRALAFRYHPDNGDSGDSEIFLRISETYRILSVSKPRQEREIARHDAMDWQTGLRRLKDKRAAVLGLLCQRRMSDYRNAFVSPAELGTLTGMTSDEIGFILWYLREKGAVTGSDSSPDYSISAKGMDILESTYQRHAPVDAVVDDVLSDASR
jgi:hypothetical protein